MSAALTQRTGVSLVLGSGAMLFTGLALAYGLVRAREPQWPPVDVPTLEPALPALATFALLGATLAVWRWGAARWLAVLFGLTFLGIQLYAWTALWRAGLTPGSGAFASLLYGLTWLHALHTAVGVAGLGAQAARARAPGGWAAYWHLVSFAWLAIAGGLFLA